MEMRGEKGGCTGNEGVDKGRAWGVGHLGCMRMLQSGDKEHLLSCEHHADPLAAKPD